VPRNSGPRGGPGMPEWGQIPIPSKLLATGVTDMVRVSDARMSGTGFGTVVLHITPESAAGGPLAIVEDGDPTGVPGVLVHGFAGSTFCWRHQIAPLADACYRVLAVDLPGFGLSSRPAGGVAGHGALAAALAGALRALRLPPAHLVAHSMGGYVASLVTPQHPGMVRPHPLVDAAIFRFPPGNWPYFDLMEQYQETKWFRQVRHNRPLLASRF